MSTYKHLLCRDSPSRFHHQGLPLFSLNSVAGNDDGWGPQHLKKHTHTSRYTHVIQHRPHKASTLHQKKKNIQTQAKRAGNSMCVSTIRTGMQPRRFQGGHTPGRARDIPTAGVSQKKKKKKEKTTRGIRSRVRHRCHEAQHPQCDKRATARTRNDGPAQTKRTGDSISWLGA
jgi:hypothetical protein